MRSSVEAEPLPRFIDFEATGLDFNTYPIEVAWSDETGWVESHLISPVGIPGWDGWSKEAEAIHHIPREVVLRDGRSPRFICERMLKTLGDGVLYSDGPPWDFDWLEKLFEAAQMMLPFEVVGMNRIQVIVVLDDEAAGILRREAEQLTGPPHRAGTDVACHVVYYRLALEHWKNSSQR